MSTKAVVPEKAAKKKAKAKAKTPVASANGKPKEKRKPRREPHLRVLRALEAGKSLTRSEISQATGVGNRVVIQATGRTDKDGIYDPVASEAAEKEFGPSYPNLLALQYIRRTEGEGAAVTFEITSKGRKWIESQRDIKLRTINTGSKPLKRERKNWVK